MPSSPNPPDPSDHTANTVPPEPPTVPTLPPAVGEEAATVSDGGRPAVAGMLPVIPGYEVEAEIARGGMGVVYRARHLRLNRPAAVKMILGGHYQNPTARLRFLVEAEAVAALDHPHVIHVHEFGTHDGLPYFALEYVGGGTLAERLKKDGRFAARAAAEMLLKLAAGTAAAHAKGIVHRDLKPGNVLLTEAGEPKISDFGLARMGNSDLTTSGAILGTPNYMAPEQAAGRVRDIGTHTDVYALGAILYELLTGRPPAQGDSVMDVIQQVIAADPPRPRTLAAGVPRDLETICLKCLSKPPQKRYPTADALAEDLRAFLEDRPVSARPPGPVERAVKWGRRNPTGAAIAALAVVAAFAVAAGVAVAQRKLETIRVQTLVAALEAAAPADLPRLRTELLAARPYAEPMLRQLLARARAADTRDPRAEFNAAAVLVEWDAGELDFLLDRAQAAPPDDLLMLRTVLKWRPDEVRALLSPVVADRGRPGAARLRAAALLLEPGATVPVELADDLAAQLLAEDRLQLSAWVRLLEPLREALLPPLSRSYAEGQNDDTGVGAALVLREYLRGDAGRAVPLIGQGGWRQAFVLGGALKGTPGAADALAAEWHRFVPDYPRDIEFFDLEEGENAAARRRARYGLALLAVGRPEPVWTALAHSPRAHLRGHLIHAFAPAGVPPQALEPGLADPDPTVRQAVYLAWGEYPREVWSAAEFERVANGVAADYAAHPDPGVHSAAEWLLRKWRQDERLKPVAAAFPEEAARGGRKWFVNKLGMRFAVIDGPVTTRVGSYQNDSGQRDGPVYGRERTHRVRIGRSYAIATHEVTGDLFTRFAAECRQHLPPGKLFARTWSSRSGDSPAVQVNWFEAAMFCRWLGEKEGVPEEQQCYPPLKDFKPGMQLRPDYLSRTGYRLPTEAEWEHAARAGSRAYFDSGSDLGLLSKFAWWERNAEFRTHPVGRLKPNPLGLFDAHGNAAEWCGVHARVYPDYDQARPVWPDTSDDTPCRPGDGGALHGGDFSNEMTRTRAAHRTMVTLDNSFPGSGLRVARTLAVPPLDVYRADGNDASVRFDVHGRMGRYRVVSVSDGVSVQPAEGDIPGAFTVEAAGRAVRSYSVTVERADTGERVTASGAFVPIDWRLRWFAWPQSPFGPTHAPTADVWAKAAAGPTLYEEARPSLTYNQAEVLALPNVPPTHRGAVATAAVELPEGTYTIDMTGNGFRAAVNGRWVLAQAWPDTPDRQTAVLHLPAGRHELRVEFWSATSHGVTDFEIRPNVNP